MHVLHKTWMYIDACICMRQCTWKHSFLKIFLSWKYFLLENLSFLNLSRSIYPWSQGCAFLSELFSFSLGNTHHLIELALIVVPDLMARLNPWRFTPSCKHLSVWLHIPRGLPILLSFVLRSGCPLGIIHPSRIHPSEWMSYLIGTVPNDFSSLT